MSFTLEKHKELIWSVYHRLEPFLEDYDKEDWYQVGLMALQRAIDTYNEDIASFSTYAYLIIRRAFVTVLKSRATLKAIPEERKFSLDQNFESIFDYEITSLHEFIPDFKNEDIEIELSKEELFNMVIDCAKSKREKLCVGIFMGIFTRKQVAERLSLSTSRINELVRDFRRKVIKILLVKYNGELGSVFDYLDERRKL